jgi:hypothetical protein
MRAAYGVLAVLSVCHPPASLLAQRAPWISAQFGAQYLRQAAPKQYGGQWLESSATGSVGLTLGLPLTSWFIPEATVHTTVGLAYPWQSASLGLGMYWRRLHGAHFRMAATRIIKTEPADCDGWPCPVPSSASERRWGYEAEGSIDLWMHRHVGIGPVLWFSNSREKPIVAREQYQSFGLGLRLSYR